MVKYLGPHLSGKSVRRGALVDHRHWRCRRYERLLGISVSCTAAILVNGIRDAYGERSMSDSGGLLSRLMTGMCPQVMWKISDIEGSGQPVREAGSARAYQEVKNLGGPCRS